jgi:hypothetical protein
MAARIGLQLRAAGVTRLGVRRHFDQSLADLDGPAVLDRAGALKDGTPFVLRCYAASHRTPSVDSVGEQIGGYLSALPWTAATRSNRSVRYRACQHGRPWADLADRRPAAGGRSTSQAAVTEKAGSGVTGAPGRPHVPVLLREVANMSPPRATPPLRQQPPFTTVYSELQLRHHRRLRQRTVPNGEAAEAFIGMQGLFSELPK